MIRKKTLAVFAVAVSLVVGLTACGAGGGNGKSGDAAADLQTTLIYGRSADADFMDAPRSNNGETSKVVENIFEGLTSFEYDGKTLNVVNNGLAEKWDVSSDGLTYTFYLRKGVKYHDGEKFTAADVVFNFDRVKNGEGEFPFYAAQFGGYGDKSNIKTTTALDDYTVEITLAKPDIYFLNTLAGTQMVMLSPKAVKAGTIDSHPVGTGPFEFVEWKKNDSITLKKNPDYWRKGFPKLEKLIYKVIADPGARATALQTGEVDVASDLNPTDVETIQKDKGLQVMFRPSQNLGYLGLTTVRKPFDDVKVRLAMNYAINKKEIVKNFYDGDAQVGVNPVAPTVVGWDPEIKDYEYDPAKAKELLAEAGYPDGFSMDLWVMPIARPYMPNPPKIGEYIQANLAEVGIKANIVTYDWSTYVEKVGTGLEADAFLLGGTASDGSATGIMDFQFKSTAQGDHNRFGYNNPEFDKLLADVRTSTDEKEMIKNLYAAQEIIHRDVPYVPLVHATPALGAVAGLKGLNPAPNGDDSMLSVTITKK